MATLKAPVRQQSYLTEYDKLLAEHLRKMSGGIGAQAIAQESALGFPVGTMTAKVLGGVLARASDKRAMNREEQSKKAARALLSGRGTDIQPQLYEDGQFEAGEYMTPDGRYVTQLAPVVEGVGETRDQYLARKLRNEQIANRNIEIEDEKALFNQFVKDQPNKASFTSTGVTDGYTGTEKDMLSAMLTGNYRGQDLQPLEPIPEITEGNLLKEGEIVSGITIEGSKKDPDWWDRNILGALPDATVRDKIELVQLAGYDPLEWSIFEQQLNEQEGKEYNFQNVSNVSLTNGTDTFETKTATRTTKSGEIEQVYWQPSTGTWQPIRNSGLSMVTEDKTKEEDKTLNRKIGFVRQWLRARNLNEDEEFIKNMAEGFTGDTFRVDPLTGQDIDELEVVYNNLKNINNIDLMSINNDKKLNDFRNKKPEQAARIDKNIQSLNDDIIKSDIGTVFRLVREVRSLIPEKGNIPGIGTIEGGLGGISPKLISPKGRKLRDTLARLMNTELRQVSGAAVTPSEFERYKEQMPVGFMKSEQQFRNAISLLERGLNNDLKTIYASYPQNIQSIYKSRDGALKPLEDDINRLKNKWKIN
tara:strand:- start:5816 stop:7579 length:1764 start_codon:yes stop_codon:yes gene_type:complete